MAHIPYDRVQWKDIDWDAVLDGTTTASECGYRSVRLVAFLVLFQGQPGPYCCLADLQAATTSALALYGRMFCRSMRELICHPLLS